MLKKTALLCATLALMATFGCASPEGGSCGSVKLHTDRDREPKSPGFWISRHPFADERLLDDQGVRRLNGHIKDELRLTKDVSQLRKTVSGEKLRKTLTDSLESFLSGTYYLKNSAVADREFLLALGRNSHTGAIPEAVKVRFALTGGYADQRILPTGEGLFERKGDTVFDELQNSSLDTGVPIAVLHESRDGKWLYAWGPSSDGWVEKEKVAFLGRARLRDYLDQQDFIVVTAARADIFLDPGMTVYHDYVRMGARFPAKRGGDPSVVEIAIPARGADGRFAQKKAYIRKDAVNFGYLPYTPRNVINQAFRLLNTPYSWGSAYSEQDCSGYVQQVFSTFGILLPRNSSAQAEVGSLLGSFGKQSEDREKISALSEKAAGGITLLHMDGHIMIFLGMRGGRPYVIHDVWSYRSRGAYGDEAKIIGRVAVTGLDLGEGSSRGSLLKRILSIRAIGRDRVPDE
jgi:hypothetical protein